MSDQISNERDNEPAKPGSSGARGYEATIDAALKYLIGAACQHAVGVELLKKVDEPTTVSLLTDMNNESNARLTAAACNYYRAVCGLPPNDELTHRPENQ